MDRHGRHFSHPHPLQLTNPETLNITPCSACNLPSQGGMYTCIPCNFTLHSSCSELPRNIIHPAHRDHPLALLPTPAYASGVFGCDACDQLGYGFNYHCNHCDFDIHLACALMLPSIHDESHPCELQLVFYPPYQTRSFTCDVCDEIGSNHWLYRCSRCNFDVHLSCARPARYIQPPSSSAGPVQMNGRATSRNIWMHALDAFIQGWKIANLVQSWMGNG